MPEVQFDNSVEIVESTSIEKLKEFLRNHYKWTFKINDKKNPYFNEVEITKGELVYKRILFGKEDVNFEVQFTSELLEILSNRRLSINEFESISNKNFKKTWLNGDRKVFRAAKKGYSFEIGISLDEL